MDLLPLRIYSLQPMTFIQASPSFLQSLFLNLKLPIRFLNLAAPLSLLFTPCSQSR